MQPHRRKLPRAAACPGAAAVHRGRTALARACLALGVLAAAAAGTVLAGAGWGASVWQSAGVPGCVPDPATTVGRPV
jgi:hypothetical protein